MLYISSKLLEACHCASEESVLITRLLSLVVNKLMGKAIFNLFTSVLLMVGCRLLSNVLMELIETMSVD